MPKYGSFGSTRSSGKSKYGSVGSHNVSRKGPKVKGNLGSFKSGKNNGDTGQMPAGGAGAV